jgi:hypothetical protein
MKGFGDKVKTMIYVKGTANPGSQLPKNENA